jgi:hypothetical protein
MEFDSHLSIQFLCMSLSLKMEKCGIYCSAMFAQVRTLEWILIHVMQTLLYHLNSSLFELLICHNSICNLHHNHVLRTEPASSYRKTLHSVGLNFNLY